MKIITLIVLALFSFLHEERYEINEYTCEKNNIKVAYDNVWYDVTLFNVFIEEDSDVCSYLDGELSIEFDSYVKIENPLNVYLFVDDELLQQLLIDHQEASVKIANPKYKYPLEKKDTKVMNEIEENHQVKEKFSNSKKIAFAFIGIWVLVCLLLLCFRLKRKHDLHNKKVKTESEKMD